MKPLREPGAVYLVTGPMAAGKSTVARLLAERFEPGVYLEGDFFRRCIVSGRREMTPEPAPEAVAQLRLRYRLAAAAADTYAREGFTVVLEDVVAGCYTYWSAEALHAAFATETPRLGLWLDTSTQTPRETVDEILRREGEALVA